MFHKLNPCCALHIDEALEPDETHRLQALKQPALELDELFIAVEELSSASLSFIIHKPPGSPRFTVVGLGGEKTQLAVLNNAKQANSFVHRSTSPPQR